MKEAWRVRILLAVALAALGVLAFSSSAAAQIVVGQVAPGVPTESTCEFETPYDEFQTAITSGASYAAPSAGVITSWSINEGPGAGPLGLKVFRPLGGGAYLVVGHDGPRPLTPNALNTFPVSIPVQAGDIVGMAVPAGAPSTCAFYTGQAGDTIGYTQGSAADGQTLTQENGFNESRLNIAATLLPPPAIAAISPAKGSIKGASVIITGSNFASVTGVNFGSAPAASFTVNSEGQITAVAPASKTLGSVPVTVSTIAGVATSPQTFTYEGCRVPQLKGKKLKAAKRKLRKANCRIGKVKKLHGATAKTGKVTKQNPKPGRILAPGTKVKVTLDL
jgi:hypothetical protein